MEQDNYKFMHVRLCSWSFFKLFSVLAFVAISALHLKYSKVPVAVNPLDLVVVVVRR